MMSFFNFVFSAFNIFLKGVVITYLWQWFVVVQFGLKPLNIVMAIGLMTLFQLMFDNREISKKKFDEEQEYKKLLSKSTLDNHNALVNFGHLLGILLALGVGYILK